MEQNKKKKYDPDFKRNAVQIADSGERTDRQAERNLGVYQGAVIRSWRSERSADPQYAFPGIGCLKPADELENVSIILGQYHLPRIRTMRSLVSGA
jgi:transposase